MRAPDWFLPALFASFLVAPTTVAGQPIPRQPLKVEQKSIAVSGPAGVSATATPDGVLVKWGAVAQAAQYVIARAPSPNAAATPVGRLPAGTLTFVDRGYTLAAAYQVIAVLANGAQAASAWVTFTPAAPQLVAIADPRPRPTIAGVHPATVPAGIGDFSVNGTNFSGVTAVRIDGKPATFAPAPIACDPRIQAGTWLSVSTSGLAGGTHTLEVVSAFGTAQASVTVVKATISTVSPAAAKPGEVVIIGGDHLAELLNFSDAGPCTSLASNSVRQPQVTFNGYLGTDVQTDGHIINVKVPAHATGVVRVGSPWHGTAEWAGFIESPRPTAMQQGSVPGGGTAFVTGTSMDVVDSVAVGNTVVPVKTKSYTSVTFVVPATLNANMAIPITLYAKIPGQIVNFAGVSNLLQLMASPKLASVTPDSAAPGDQITLKGTALGLPPAGTANWKPQVTFNGAASPSVIVNTMDMLTAVVPDNATSGPVVVVASTGPLPGPSLRINRTPRLQSIYPGTGQRIGQPVQIIIRSGSAPTAIVFGAVTVTSGFSASADYGQFTITMNVPPGATTGAVKITTADGTTAWTAAPWVIMP